MKTKDCPFCKGKKWFKDIEFKNDKSVSGQMCSKCEKELNIYLTTK